MSVPTCSVLGRSLLTADTGWIIAGITFKATANPAANMRSADTFARTMTPRASGSGPRISVSRLSRASASHTETATSAMTVIDHAA